MQKGKGSFKGKRNNDKFSKGKPNPDKKQLRPKPKAKQTPSDDKIRLNKYLADAGICSRREADTFIAAGIVEVNGKVVTELGTRVSPTDIVHYGGEKISPEKVVYLVMNKPKDYLVTSDDPFNRKTVMSIISSACKERVLPVGRMDRQATGVLLLTNDGGLIKKLTNPKNLVKQIYYVVLDKNLTAVDLEKIQDGVEVDGSPVNIDEISYVKGNKSELGIVIHSGRNRIIRRLFEELGYHLIKLDRVEYAGLTKKELSRGKWRYLSDKEVGFLKMLS